MSDRLPIDDLRPAFEARLPEGPVVVSAPTGSGKSTQIPRWLRAKGRVLVVEPRRVACRSLAQRVAHLEGTALGDGVGYRVRDDDRSGPRTEVLFVTPGVALRMLAGGDGERWPTLVIDEFHERSLDTDLLLALAQANHPGALVVMSATLEGDRVAAHLGGVHLAGEGRLHPVEIRHIDDGHTLPHDRGLASRVAAAIDAAARDPGDVLVFLPGKAEIGACASRLSGRRDLAVVPLHGGLTLKEQGQAFEKSSKRKVILATNVAETSLTLPGIGVVIDTGLVRRTRYHNGRGFLTLMPVALDSADQRAGRAGRLGPGVCYRLWAQRARLDAHTPPEIHRESLVPLLMGAAACGAHVDHLAFVDPPKAHAVEAARAELRALDALDEADRLAPVGRALFGLPLDAPLGRLLVQARDSEVLPEMVDLVAALAVGRPLWRPGPPPSDPEDDLRDAGCDATAFIRAVREGDPDRHGLRPFSLAEARRIARRLRKAFGLGRPAPDRVIDRRALALTAMAADRRVAHVIRRRKKSVAWSNGGTELELGRECGLKRVLDTPDGRHVEACLVFESRALGIDERRTAILITCAMPVPLAWLVAGGVGRERVGRVLVDKRRRRLVAKVERVHARKVLTSYEEVPQGELARTALIQAFLEGRLWPKTLEQTRERLQARALHARLQANQGGGAPAEVPALEDWVRDAVDALGLESGEDLALMSPDDLLAEDLPAWERDALDRDFPRRIEYRDATFEVRYDLRKRWVHLDQVAGSRKDPPPRQWLPTFRGFGVEWHRRNHSRVVKPRP